MTTDAWIPAFAGMTNAWIPAFAGMTNAWIPAFAGMTVILAGMTAIFAGLTINFLFPSVIPAKAGIHSFSPPASSSSIERLS